MARVLLADNDPDSLKLWAAVLREEGYNVTKASSMSSAKTCLDKGGFDLAVLELHLENAEDENDQSGLKLAQAYGDSLPIIMLTANPAVDVAIKALQPDGRSSTAVALVRKREDGPKALLKAARKAIVPKVVVSHGHDNSAQAAVIKFLLDSGVRPVVLLEQSVSRQESLEVFVTLFDIEFAIILVTPDDVGGRKGDALRPRARQNVLFELGFFLSKLGRNRVIALYKDEDEAIELPSNFQGILYLKMEGDWRIELAREMAVMGIELRVV